MSLPALTGDSFDIDLACEVITLPTVGPLFGSFKVQLDVFQIPIRVYNAMLHMNRVEIGNDMSQVLLPQVTLQFDKRDGENLTDDNIQVHPSSLYKYLGISGLGYPTGVEGIHFRRFNAIPYLGYFDIYKNYYANKQEERGFTIHTDRDTIGMGQEVRSATVYLDGAYNGNCYGLPVNVDTSAGVVTCDIVLETGALEPKPETLTIDLNASTEILTLIVTGKP